YGIYVRHILKMEHHGMEDLEPLMAARFLHVAPKGRWSVLQVLVSLAMIVVGAHFFVGAVTHVSAVLGMSAMILSVLITPIATELPEKLNSIIWIGKGKDVLALGNITGAMVFQSSFPVVFGMLFTTWELRGATLLAGLLALISGLWMLLWLRLRRSISPWTLLAGGAFYGVFIAYVAIGGR
ncbi:MAG: sodium:calcium antiporter, partial [bacterium]